MDIRCRRMFAKDMIGYNYSRTIANELEQESGDLADAFGSKLHHLVLLTRGQYLSMSDRVTFNQKSNNRFYAASLCKNGRFALTTLFTRHSRETDGSVLINTATNKSILAKLQASNAYQFELARVGSNLYAYSKVVDTDGCISIYDFKMRKAGKFALDNLAFIEAKVLALVDSYIVILNPEENALEIYLHDLADPATFKTKHAKHSYISLWRYGS